MKKLATDPKWVIYRQELNFNDEKKQFEPNLRITDKGKATLELAKGIMVNALDIHHWNELRDRVKELYGNTIVSLIDASGLVINVLNTKGV